MDTQNITNSLMETIKILSNNVNQLKEYNEVRQRNDELKNENKKLIQYIVKLATPPDYDKPVLFNITDYDLMKLLIENGADVNAKEIKTITHNYKTIQTRTKTILHKAEDPKIVKLLIDSGADVNIEDDLGYTPIFYAKSVEVAKLLIEAGADCSQSHGYAKWQSPFNRINDLNIVWFMVQQCPNIFWNLSDKIHYKLIRLFVEANHIEYIKFVVKEHKTLLDCRPRSFISERSVLTYATTKEMFKLLVLNGAKIEKATEWFNRHESDDKVWKSSELFKSAWRLNEDSKQFEYIGFL